MPTCRAVVFDLDGTLLDTYQDIASACNSALKQASFAQLPPEQIVRYIGNGATVLVAKAAQLHQSDPRVSKLLASYLEKYEQNPCANTTWLPFAKQTLERLADMPLALYTNKPRAVTLSILRHLNAEHHFQVIVAGGDMPRPKPTADGLLHIANSLGVHPNELVMVGDGPQDVFTGKLVGARTVAVSAGYTSYSFLREMHPDVLLHDMSELVEVVQRWRESTTRFRRSSQPTAE